MIEVAPATLNQVMRGRGGHLITLENDTAKQLAEISSHLRFPLKLRYNEQGEYYAVYQVLENGVDEHLVTTAQQCDSRLIEKIRKVIHPSYDFAAEVEQEEKKVQKEQDHKFHEQVGEISERYAHAIREDLRKARPGPVYIPPDVYRNNRRK